MCPLTGYGKRGVRVRVRACMFALVLTLCVIAKVRACFVSAFSLTFTGINVLSSRFYSVIVCLIQ